MPDDTPTAGRESCRAGEGGGPSRQAPVFVVFSDDWGVHPSSCQHIFRHLAVDHRVFWVNTIGMREPRLTLADIAKALRKLGRMLPRSAARWRRAAARRTDLQPAGLEVVQPLMLPFGDYAAVRAFNRASVLRTVSQWLRCHSPQDVIVVTTVPNVAEFLDGFKGMRIVYYCVDDFSRWPGLEHTRVAAMEAVLMRRADVLIATSARLHARFLEAGRSAHLLTHGVDVRHFSSAVEHSHPCLQSLARPRAGYFGLIDGRSDLELLALLARACPDWTFVMTGPVEIDVSALALLGNVHFTGALPYQDLPALAAGLDALLLPYRVDAFTATISPLKFKEYLLTGRPVISTPIAEAMQYRQWITIAREPADWRLALEAARGADTLARRRRLLAAFGGESWQAKAAELLAIACAGGDPRSNSAGRTGT